MSKDILINGQKELSGEVNISGAKNAAVAILPATILASDTCLIENLPDICDVKVIIKALEVLGSKCVFKNKNKLEISTKNINNYIADIDELKDIRASYYFLGALLARFGQAQVVLPGGCCFAVRPIDQHVKGLEAMGAKIKIEHGYIKASSNKRLKGADIYLDMASVGATINIMLAAVSADGVTNIDNAAKEPHVVDTANFLNMIGANIKGAGTDSIKITGVNLNNLHDARYSIIPDQIEAGTYILAAVATRSNLIIKNIIPRHVDSLSAKLKELGCVIKDGGDYLEIIAKDKKFSSINIKAMSYPGFPSDLQPQTAALLSTVKGTSVITDSIWSDRFQYINELKKLGADIKLENGVAIINGSRDCLTGANISAHDLRAGAALVLAALCSRGKTKISNSAFIDRGYEDICGKFRSLGADIKRVDNKSLRSKKAKQN